MGGRPVTGRVPEPITAEVVATAEREKGLAVEVFVEALRVMHFRETEPMFYAAILFSKANYYGINWPDRFLCDGGDA